MLSWFVVIVVVVVVALKPVVCGQITPLPPPLRHDHDPSPSPILFAQQMRTSWVMKGIKRSEDGGYLLAFDTPKGPKRLQAKVAVCTAPAHRLASVEGLRVRRDDKGSDLSNISVV